MLHCTFANQLGWAFLQFEYIKFFLELLVSYLFYNWFNFPSHCAPTQILPVLDRSFKPTLCSISLQVKLGQVRLFLTFFGACRSHNLVMLTYSMADAARHDSMAQGGIFCTMTNTKPTLSGLMTTHYTASLQLWDICCIFLLWWVHFVFLMKVVQEHTLY